MSHVGHQSNFSSGCVLESWEAERARERSKIRSISRCTVRSSFQGSYDQRVIDIVADCCRFVVVVFGLLRMNERVLVYIAVPMQRRSCGNTVLKFESEKNLF